MPTPIDRSIVVAGPGWIENPGSSLSVFVKGGIALDTDIKTFDLMQDGGGGDLHLDDVDMKISATPSGEITSGLLGLYYPSWLCYGLIGSGVFSGTDVPYNIWSAGAAAAQTKYAFASCAIETPPEFLASSRAAAIGKLTLRSLVANATARSTANSQLTITTGQTFGGTAPAPANILTPSYTITWGGSSPWNSILTEKGIRIKPTAEIEWIGQDGHGVYQGIVKKVRWNAELLTPLNNTEAQMLALMNIQGSGNVQGATRTKNDLVVTGTATGTPLITLKACLVAGAHKQEWGETSRRFNNLLFQATQTSTANPLAVIGVN